VALCVFLFPFGAALPQQDINRLLDSVVSISVASNIPNAPGHFGTGFVISATGGDILIVTARHVLFSKEGDPIFDPKRLLVTFRADRYNPRPASVLVNGPDNLLFSVLKVARKDAGSLHAFPAFELRTRPVEFSEDVLVMTGEWTTPKMSVSSPTLEKRLDQFSYNGFGIAPGYSGAPVIDKDHRLIGIHQGELPGLKDGWAQRMQEVVATLKGPTMGLKTDIETAAIDNIAGVSPALSVGIPGSPNCSSATAESLQLSLKSQALPRVLENLRCRPENAADAESQSIISGMFDAGNFAKFRHFLDGLSKTPLFVAPVVCSSAHRAIYTGNFDALAWLLSNFAGSAVQSCAGFTSDLTAALTLAPSDFLSGVISQLKTAGLAVEYDEYALFRAAFEGYAGYDFPRLKQLSDITAPHDAEHFNEAKSRAEAHVMSTTPLFVQGQTDPMHERSRQIIQKRMDEYCPESAAYCAQIGLAVHTPPRATATRPEFIENETGLMWTAAASSTAMDWPHAVEYCTSLNRADQRDWRLPGVDELMHLYDTSQRSSGCQTRSREPITVHIREGIDPSCGDVWTGKKSTRQLRLGGYTFDYAWLFDFAAGAPKEDPATWIGTATIYHHHVLCVRSNTR
jgi:hypothetical protein